MYFFVFVGVATNVNIIEGNEWVLFLGVKMSDSPSTLNTYWRGTGSDKYRQQHLLLRHA